MAKKSVVLRDQQRRLVVAHHADKRAELKKKSLDLSLSDEDRFLARYQLQALPRNSSKVRLRNRCQFTGRPRGVFKKFMISRIVLREIAPQGLIPGMRKASW
jgi:small subunit ribosomal protein S14